MKIATFKRMGTSYPYDIIRPEADEQYLTADGGYVRTSEYVDAEFQPLKSDQVVQQQLDALDKAEGELRNKFQAALNVLEQQRAELRAITHQK